MVNLSLLGIAIVLYWIGFDIINRRDDDTDRRRRDISRHLHDD